jgi:hypothetical protein
MRALITPATQLARRKPSGLEGLSYRSKNHSGYNI